MLRYFFWEGKLHRTLITDPARNTLTAWCYDDAKKVQFVYSHIRVHRERAWRTSEVLKMLNRSRPTMARYVLNGKVRPPVKSYSLDGKNYPGIGWWRAKDIYAFHEALLEPNEKGELRAKAGIPSRMELTAMMEEGASYILRDNEGNETRVFRETLW